MWKNLRKIINGDASRFFREYPQLHHRDHVRSCFSSVGIQYFNMNDFLDFLNDGKPEVVVKTNAMFNENMHDDEFKPSSIVFLVMSKETADKILVLGHLPLSCYP